MILTDIVKQCRSFDYINECYIEEFSKKENYTSLFPTIPEEMLVRCLATNDCPELLINVSTKAIDVFKEAEEQEEKEREFNRKAKWEAERPQRIEAEIGAMKILLEENQAEIKKLREELAKKSS
nr:hypothetical protein [Moritella viscosa]SHO15513.1 Putative uncharacterized protein [Moritella viscosa]